LKADNKLGLNCSEVFDYEPSPSSVCSPALLQLQ